MHNVTKTILALFAASVLFFSQTGLISAERRIIDLDFEGQTLSARIRNAPLRAVITKIKKEEDVWVKAWLKGSESLLDEEISVRFRNVPIEEGLGRIFSSVNHSFFFDRNENLLGVFLLGKSDKKRTKFRRPRARKPRVPKKVSRKHKRARRRNIHLQP